MAGSSPDTPGAPVPAVAAVRRAVRHALDALPAPVRAAPLLVACSGGADSTALLAAARAVAPGRVHVAVVDHGLQDGLRRTQRRARRRPGRAGRSGGRARRGRRRRAAGSRPPPAAPGYAALRAARPHPDSPVLLGHTLDDQAETVLLGLGRGSGARSLAGMRDLGPALAAPAARPAARRTRGGVPAQGLPVWDDPHNVDPRFTRVRLRHEVLPLLEDVLAGGVAEALARTAAQLRDDGEALDAAAARPARPGGRRGRRSAATRRAGRTTRATRGRRADTPARRRRARRRSRRASAAGPCAPGWAPAASPGSPTSTCAPPTTSSAAGADRAGSRCRGGWSWFARMGGCGCARRRGRAPDESGPGPAARRRRRPHEPQEDPPCTTGTSRPY